MMVDSKMKGREFRLPVKSAADITATGRAEP